MFTTEVRIHVLLITDEPEAVLAILAKKQANQAIPESDWQRLFASEGYVRLKKREAAMHAAFEDADFKAFVLAPPTIERRQSLTETLDRWKRADITAAAGRALAYLPAEARIKAKVYPVIKPQGNSFVFDQQTDPAIFLYLNPALSKEQFENKVAHELYHIGQDENCPSKETAAEIAKLPENAHIVMNWLGSFGEGLAMLAAAGGPDTHPHEYSNAEDRARWDRDVANFNSDLKKVDQFFLDVLQNHFSKRDDLIEAGSSFYGTQGPWYTVGWKMAVTIENIYGRAKLIECVCDERKLLSTYNQAAEYNRTAKEPLALWSPSVVEAVLAK